MCSPNAAASAAPHPRRRPARADPARRRDVARRRRGRRPRQRRRRRARRRADPRSTARSSASPTASSSAARVHAPWHARRAAAASGRSPASSRVHVDELFEPRPARRRDLPARRRRHRPRAAGARRARCSSCRSRRCCADDCAGLCPTCGADRNTTPCDCAVDDLDPRWAALAACDRPRSRTVPRSTRMAVPKRKTSRSATRSRKSANMQLSRPAALAVPELRRVAAPAHRVRQLRLVPGPAGARRRVDRGDARWPTAGAVTTPVIAVDAMGGDRAPGEIVAGGLRAAAELDVDVLLVGPARRDRRRMLPGGRPAGRRRAAPGARGRRDGRRARRARCARRRTRRSCAAPRRCATARADAMVGAGNTGATMAAALLAHGPDPGRAPARRSRCRSPCPAPTARSILVDGGATVDPRARVARAVGACWAASTPRVRLGVDEPTVGAALERRGSRARATSCARRRTRCSRDVKGFVGNVEGRDLMQRRRRRHRHRRLHRQRRAEDARRRDARPRRPRVRRCVDEPDVRSGGRRA